MVGAKGFEASTSWSRTRHLNPINALSGVAYGTRSVISPLLVVPKLYLAFAIRKKLVDVAGIEPATPYLQTRRGKTLTALSGVAYAEISEISALLNVPKLSRKGSFKPTLFVYNVFAAGEVADVCRRESQHEEAPRFRDGPDQPSPCP